MAWVPGQIAVVEPEPTTLSTSAMPEYVFFSLSCSTFQLKKSSIFKKNRYEAKTNAEFEFQNPSHVVPGHVDESVFSIWLNSVGDVQKIRSPILEIESVKGDDGVPVATPKFVGPLAQGET